MKKCGSCGSTNLTIREADSFFDYETGEGDDYYAFCVCNKCGREASGWDEDECATLVESTDKSLHSYGTAILDVSGRNGI